MKRIGFIGYGLRSETMMKSFRSLEADITVTAVADPRHAEIAPGLAGDPYFAHTRWYADADELLAGEALDGVFIGTRCSCLLYTSPSPRDGLLSRMPSSA